MLSLWGTWDAPIIQGTQEAKLREWEIQYSMNYKTLSLSCPHKKKVCMCFGGTKLMTNLNLSKNIFKILWYAKC